MHTMIELRPFQREFLTGALAPGIDTACLSLPRGNGKSTLAAHLVGRILSPDDELFRPGTESVLLAASIEQARIVFRFAREVLGEGEHHYTDAANRVSITHKPTNTRLRVIGSKGKTAMGLGADTPWAIWDEPGASDVVGGQLMHDALTTALGKPESEMRLLLIGTIAPSATGWWRHMAESGSIGSTFAMLRQCDDLERWDDWGMIRRCNPLAEISQRFRDKLKQERDAARTDSQLKARFLSYRLNYPAGDETQMLVTVPDWGVALKRPVPPREGVPYCAVDLGYSRAWSAVTAVYRNGRTEARAVAPGIPGLVAQEKRDRVPRGTYQTLADSGALRVAEGLRVPPVQMVMDLLGETWGRPDSIICDRARIGELRDYRPPGVPLVERATRGKFEPAADIRAFRRAVKDGPLSVSECSRALISTSMTAAIVKNDESGCFWLVKSSHNTARDDVIASLLLNVGHISPEFYKPARKRRFG